MKIVHAVVALVLGYAGNVSAACMTGDIAGTWYSHTAFFDYTGAGGGDWARCKLVINSSGGVSTSASQCRLASGTLLTVSAGTVQVNSSCALSGSITTTRNGATVARMVLQYGQMDSSHHSFSALGYNSNQSKWKFLMQAVEQ
ncbi:MAG: hypothetical protein HY941_02735 [Gammaproteobacteria bacterium]|nr:hypothetical protein [Gammaproteobacteria bacterium]